LARTGAYAAAGTADALGPDDEGSLNDTMLKGYGPRSSGSRASRSVAGIAGAGSKVGTFSLVFAEVGEVAEIPEVGVEHLSPFSRSMR
jgi:hypothetical protein